MEHLEIEVKFHVTDEARLRQRLLACGAMPQERVFETNIRFDDAQNRLLNTGQLLRLRRDTASRLTFKTPPAGNELGEKNSRPENDFKIYNETEINVSDFEDTRKILTHLGFIEVQRYEKWRQTFLAGQAHLCLDTLPYGIFLEIEGEKDDIVRLAGLLGLPWEQRILANYLEIFDYLKERHGLPGADLTFENFSGIRIDLPDLLDRFQAGS